MGSNRFGVNTVESSHLGAVVSAPSFVVLTASFIRRATPFGVSGYRMELFPVYLLLPHSQDLPTVSDGCDSFSASP